MKNVNLKLTTKLILTNQHRARVDEIFNEINLQLFTVDFTGNVYETRNNLIKKLEEQEEIDKILKMFVNDYETYVDKYNVHWKVTNIILRTKLHSDLWSEDKFRKHIFQKCYLSENVTTNNGTISMDDLNKRR